MLMTVSLEGVSGNGRQEEKGHSHSCTC